MCEDCGGFIGFVGKLGKSFLATCLNCGKPHAFSRGRQIDLMHTNI